MGACAAAYERSIADPTRFWGLAARDVRWLVPRTGCWTTARRRSTAGSPAVS